MERPIEIRRNPITGRTCRIAFSRADDMVPCNIGAAGMCCKQCGMGPCRLTNDGQAGVCGATLDTIQARNLYDKSHPDRGVDMEMEGVSEEIAQGESENRFQQAWKVLFDPKRKGASLSEIVSSAGNWIRNTPDKDRNPELEAGDVLMMLFVTMSRRTIAPVTGGRSTPCTTSPTASPTRSRA